MLSSITTTKLLKSSKQQLLTWIVPTFALPKEIMIEVEVSYYSFELIIYSVIAHTNICKHSTQFSELMDTWLPNASKSDTMVDQ